MNAVIYARYSSHSQNEMSIEGQLKETYAYAKREGYTVLKEYVDRALTATTDKRPEFQKMIADSAKKSFQIVIVYQLDRFARNRFDSAIYKKHLKKNGVKVVSVREPISDDPSGVLIEGVLEAYAEYFSLDLAQKIMRGIKLSMENGKHIGGAIPLGYTVNSEKKFEINPSTAPIVQDIFNLYANGRTLKEVGEIIMQQHDIKIGNVFNFIGKILDNRNYVGTYTRGGHMVENAVPRIITDELFERV
jgi:DNA invertase Pin-like site-specific DNA recombinase